MNRLEFEQKITECNLTSFYDGNIYPPFDNGWRTYTNADKYVNREGLYGVYEANGKWVCYTTGYNDRGPEKGYYKECNSEAEAFELLFKLVMKSKDQTNTKRAEKQVMEFISEINQKKIQKEFYTLKDSAEITLEELDKIIFNVFGEKYTYTFINGIDIIEKESHNTILNVYCYTPYDSIKKRYNYDVFVPFMHCFDFDYYLNGKEMSHDFVTHMVDENYIYFMYYRDIIKTDLKGNEIWHKHFPYNKENDIYLHSHIFLSTWNWHDSKYPSDKYICITNGFNSYVVNKEDGKMNKLF